MAVPSAGLGWESSSDMQAPPFCPYSLCHSPQCPWLAGSRHWKQGHVLCHCHCPQLSLVTRTAAPCSPQLEQGRSSSWFPLFPGLLGTVSMAGRLLLPVPVLASWGHSALTGSRCRRGNPITSASLSKPGTLQYCSLQLQQGRGSPANPPIPS